MTKEKLKDELKDRISMALKDTILQQGFEIICKNLSVLERRNDNLVKMYNEVVERQNSLQQSLYKNLAELEKENAKLKKESEENQDLATIAYMQGASKYKTKLEYAKTIIQDLLRNSDEYARQRAMDFLEGE